MLTQEMLDSIKKVEATRPSRIGADLRRMDADEKHNLLKQYHPDYKESGFSTLVMGPNKGEKVPVELGELLQANSRLLGVDLDLNQIDYDVDVLVIGGGGAGASAAIEAHKGGANVMIATKLRIGDANTMMAEGGIQAADKENDSPQRHFLDAFGGGHYAAKPELLKKLVSIRYERNDIAFERNMFRVRGDTVEIFPAYWKDSAIRVEFFGDEIDRISEINVVTGAVIRRLETIPIWPATHYVTPKEKMDAAVQEIYKELEERVAFFQANNQLIEAQRIKQRTMYDVEMMQELGYCTGIENYSRVIEGRAPGSPPHTLLDYFPKDFVLFIDESHVTLPQVRAMYNGDKARKTSLVDYGFRLPCAFDNRPLKFDEFQKRLNQVVYVSATPGDYERERSGQIVEQVIRPTGLLDPKIEVRPVEGQIDDLIGEINARTARSERVLVTTLTKKMAEDLTTYLTNAGIKVRYMHHDIDTIERMEIIRDLRLGTFDVLVGINLLREGLDLPEVSLVAILDADKEGFLRSETSLIQTIGRAARNADGLVVMYADSITPSMRRAIDETERRRAKQDAFNREHGIVPKTVIKSVRDVIDLSGDKDELPHSQKALSKKEREAAIAKLEKEMREASKRLEFEYAAVLRDRIIELRGHG